MRVTPQVLFAGLTAAVLLNACQRSAPGALGAGDIDHAVAVLEAAPMEGFAPDAFRARELRALGVSERPEDRARRDSLLRSEVLAYARAEHGLAIPARAMPSDWGLRPPPYDAQADLAHALAAHRFRAWIDALPPASPRYQALRAGYARYLKVVAAGGWPALPPSPLRPGQRGPAVDALRRRLNFEDPAIPAAAPGSPYDPSLAAAVARAQLRYGLPPTGAADAQTIAALNVPADARAAQIRANLERLRWLPAVDPPTRVDVNTAAATFDYVEDGRPALHMLAAAGRPGDETPILASAVDAVVLNPPWNVPDGIAQDELYPKEQSQPGYFAAHGFKVTDAGGAPRLVQEPGPDSALGLVKFEFRNPYAVYMHDTPAKAAFARTDRAVSHGCVRLQAAVDFAKRLLSRESGWPAERVDEVIASRETTHIPLKHKVPVRLVYLTAFPEGVGVSFRDDIYGWDPLLLSVLDANAGRLPAQGARVATR